MAKPSIGKVVWFEIPVSNVEKAKAFYGELFNWRFGPFDEFQKGYCMIDTDQEDLSGGFVSKTSSSTAAFSPIIYFSVMDIPEALAKAERMGAKIIKAKTIITEQAGYFAHLTDPDGNFFAIWSQT